MIKPGNWPSWPASDFKVDQKYLIKNILSLDIPVNEIMLTDPENS